MSVVRSRVIVLLLFIYLDCTTCRSVENVLEKWSKTLAEAKSLRSTRGSEDISPIWEEYEFGTGAGNREELVITNVTIHQFTKVETEVNWQYFRANGTDYLASITRSIFLLYKLNIENFTDDDLVKLKIDGVILTFKVITITQEENQSSKCDVVIVLCVETDNGTFLQWYRVLENYFELFWSWPVQKQIKDLEFIAYGGRNKLLLLDDDEIHFGKHYSSIHVYCFSIDFTASNFNFWLCQRILVPKAFDIQVCSNYEGISLALQGINNVLLYKYRDTTVGSLFQEFQTIKSHDLNNFVCFESGYIQYLAISGPEAGLFNYVDDEYQFNSESDSNFETSDISWIKDIPLNTYRSESLLLYQLRNSTVVALTWHGSGFKKAQLPSKVLDQFALWGITVIPNFGFVCKNQLVKFDIELKDFKRPTQDKTEGMIETQTLLNIVLQNQENILNETEARIEKSYLKNPEVTGFWNLTYVNATKATIKDDIISESIIHVGSSNLTWDDLKFNASLDGRILNLEQKLDKIISNLNDTRNSNLTKFDSDSDITISGGINIAGTLHVDNLIVNFINGVPVNDSIIKSKEIISDEKNIFSAIEASNLTILSINGIPIDEIYFGNSKKDYSDIDFFKITSAEIDEHLSFSMINGVDWETTMENVVWKDKSAIIPGNTIIEGTIIADEVYLDNVNDLRYPHDYVLDFVFDVVNVTGAKTFDKLSTANLGIHTLNDIPIEDFVTLHDNNVLDKEITFENLIVEGRLQVDGNIVGVELEKYFTLDKTSEILSDVTFSNLTVDGDIVGVELEEFFTLNETSEILSDVTFTNLTVLGKITVENSIADKNWSDFKDLLLKTDRNIEITGTKKFLGDVEISSNLIIRSGMINGHSIDEFATLDTDQEFPNLQKLPANVTFGKVTHEAINKLETLLNDNKNASTNCSDKIIIFKSPIIVDELSFNTLRSNISEEDFMLKLNQTFKNVYFDQLSLKTLIAEEITPKFINNVNFTNFLENLTKPVIIDDYAIENLEVDTLYLKHLNGMSLEELNSLKDHFKNLSKKIFDGNVSLDSLQVTGTINTKSINGQVLEELYTEDRMGTVIFEEDISIENLTVLGLTNGLNFSEYVSDTILKTDRDIVVTGRKTFESINCHYLDAASVNGHFMGNILDPFKEQVLKGPVVVNGSVTVLKNFNASGKIGDVPFGKLIDRFRKLDNNSYQLYGNFDFSNNVSVGNLYSNGAIQGIGLDDFLENVILKNEENVIVSGFKLFNNSVNFNGTLVVNDTLNDLDLQKFTEKVVFIDEPFSIESKISFEESIKIEKDLVIKTQFKTNTMMGVDMSELEASVMYLNRPTYVADSLTLTDAQFKQNIEVEKINNLDMSLLIPLHTEQMISVDVLKCHDVTGEKLEILGKINGHSIDDIKQDTFMLIGEQNITGHINFRGNAYARHGFDARSINGIDPKQIIDLNSKNTLSGNFVFKDRIVLNQSLRVLGHVNGINPTRWQAVAVTNSLPMRQIISGEWTIHGDVYFENGTTGTDILDGVNITETARALAEANMEMHDIMAETSMNLNYMCEDLKLLKASAENQIYKFSAFDYLQVFEFDKNIVSIHYFELEDLDYLLVSYDTCHMEAFLFTGAEFESVANVSDFGAVDQWLSFKYDKALHILTVGKNSCGRSLGNLWKLEDDEFIHVLDLGNVTENHEVNKALQTLNNKHKDEPADETNVSHSPENENSKLVFNYDEVVSSTGPSISKYEKGTHNHTNIEECFCGSEALSFKAGINEKELFLSYDEGVSKDYIFICRNDQERRRVHQTIKTYKPSSFKIINFEGLIETLLVFVENGKNIQIYEYLGIQGFVYRDNIRSDVDKLFTFEIRKHHNLARRQCLALIRENRLTILEAKMYGEKLEMGELWCSRD